MAEQHSVDTAELLTLTADIVAAHVGNHPVGVDDVAVLISSVHGALAGLGAAAPPEETRPEPAVSVRASVKRDRIVCLEDGRQFRTLKRHLMSEHGLTPDEYRARWSLAPDYPMVAADYAQTRRDLAVRMGLGRKPGQRRGRRKMT